MPGHDMKMMMTPAVMAAKCDDNVNDDGSMVR